MNDPLTSIFEFLARTGAEVEGRTVETPPPDLQEKLRRFACGRGNAKERTELCDLLRSRPDWMKWMVDLVRSDRESSPGT